MVTTMQQTLMTDEEAFLHQIDYEQAVTVQALALMDQASLANIGGVVEAGGPPEELERLAERLEPLFRHIADNPGVIGSTTVGHLACLVLLLYSVPSFSPAARRTGLPTQIDRVRSAPFRLEF
jgi:hypothetical protein